MKTGSFFENSRFIFLTKTSLTCSTLIITILIAQKLGPDQLGVYSIAMGFYAIFQIMSMMGYDAVVVREIAKDQNKGDWLLGHGIVLGVFSSTIGAVLMGIAGRFLNYSPSIMKVIVTLSIALFPSFLNLLAETVFIGLKKAGFAFYTAIIREAVWLLLSMWWLSMGKGINAVLYAFVISRVIGVGLLVIFLHRERIFWWKNFHWIGFKEMLGLIPTFLMINLLSNLLMEVDVILLSKLVPVAEVGFYNLAKRVLRVSFTMVFSIVTAMFPIIVETMHKKRKEILLCFNGFSFRILMISSIIVIFVSIFAHAIIMVFLGPAFIQSVGYIHVLIWKIIPLSLGLLWSRFLIAANQQNKDLLALIIGLPMFLGLGILFVRVWGVIGMAYADILIFTCIALCHLFFVNRTIFQTYEKA